MFSPIKNIMRSGYVVVATTTPMLQEARIRHAAQLNERALSTAHGKQWAGWQTEI